MQNAGSLVKYHTPILVNTIGTKNLKKGTKKAGMSEKQTTQTEDILNSILPPRCVKSVPQWSSVINSIFSRHISKISSIFVSLFIVNHYLCISFAEEFWLPVES
jgi:hypothetical protein